METGVITADKVAEIAAADKAKPAGMGEDPLDGVAKEIIGEVRDFARDMLERVLRVTTHENFGRAMQLIARISRAQANFTVDLLPGVEDVNRVHRAGDYGGGAMQMSPIESGISQPSIETFGATMMKELTGHLTAQQADKNKPDINKLMMSLEKAEEMGQTVVAEALQKKIDEVVESGDFVTESYIEPRLPLPPALPVATGEKAASTWKPGDPPPDGMVECPVCKLCYVVELCPGGCPYDHGAKEEKDADDVVSPEQ